MNEFTISQELAAGDKGSRAKAPFHEAVPFQRQAQTRSALQQLIEGIALARSGSPAPGKEGNGVEELEHRRTFPGRLPQQKLVLLDIFHWR